MSQKIETPKNGTLQKIILWICGGAIALLVTLSNHRLDKVEAKAEENKNNVIDLKVSTSENKIRYENIEKLLSRIERKLDKMDNEN